MIDWRNPRVARRRRRKPLLWDAKLLNCVYGGLNSSGTTVQEQAHFDAIFRAGFNGCRIGPRWEHIEPTLGAGIDTSLITQVVRRCANAGLTVLIELHHTGTSSFPVGASTAVMIDTVTNDSVEAVKALTRIALNEPNVIAIGTANEVAETTLSSQIVSCNLTLERVIRQAGWRGIVLGMVNNGQNTNGGSWASFMDAHPLNMLETHWYFGGGHADGFGSVQAGGGRFSSQGANLSNGTTALSATASFPQFEAHMERWLAMPGIDQKRVFMGEWGIGLDESGAGQFVDYMRQVMDSRGIGNAWWRDIDAGAKMAIFRNADSSATLPHALTRRIVQ